MHTTSAVAAPPTPGQDREEPELAQEDDIPSQDHDPDGTPPGRAHDGDEVERHAEQA